MSARSMVCGGLLVCAMVAGACDSFGDGGQETQVEAPPATEGSVPTDGDEGAAEPAEVIASAEGQVRSGGDAGPVRVDVTSLVRTANNMVTLEFTLTLLEPTTDGDDELVLLGQLGEALADWTVGGVSLIDETEQKRYLVFRDTDDQCLCSDARSPLLLDVPQPHFATFPAPPDSTESVTVVIPNITPIQDVPISSG